MNHFYQETRRDRWVRLPYALLSVMLIAGALSYFLDRPQPSVAPPTTQQRAEEYIKRRIAEHNQATATKEAEPTPAKPAAPPVAPNANPAKMEPLSKPAAAPVSNGSFGLSDGLDVGKAWLERLDLPARWQAIKQMRQKWLLATLLLPVIGLLVWYRRRSAPSVTHILPESTNQTERITKAAVTTPAIDALIAAAPSKKENRAVTILPAPGAREVKLFSLYLTEEKTDDSSFFETYIKPTFASFRGLFSRKREAYDPMHLLTPALTDSPPQTELTAPHHLFRRAVITRR